MGRGNTIIRDREGNSFPSFYIDYYEHNEELDDDEEPYCNGNPCHCNDNFVSDILGNIRCSIIKEFKNVEIVYFQPTKIKSFKEPVKGSDYYPVPELFRDNWNNDYGIYFRTNIFEVVIADNESQMAIGCIPIYNYNDKYNSYIFKRSANKFMKLFNEMYVIYARSSAWTSNKINDDCKQFYS